MMTTIRNWGLGCVVTGMLFSTASVHADDTEGVVRMNRSAAAGVVRISDQGGAVRVVRAQSEEADSAQPLQIQQSAHCEPEPLYSVNGAQGDSGSYADGNLQNGNCPNGNCPPEYVVVEGDGHCRKSKWKNWFHGTDCPPASHGHHRHCHKGPGRPLAGCYSMVYPVDPGYFDRRDGQVYAAPGYGGPVSVPLAPVVNSTYNYGWGIPSSRLTPVLHPATQAPVSQIPSPYPSAPIAY